MLKTTFPPLPTWTPYSDAVAAYEALNADLRQAHRDLEALQRGGPAAAKQDDQAQASALRAGKADPGRKATLKWKADVEAAKTRARVLEAAAGQQEQAVRALLRENPEQATEAAEKAHADAADRYRRALADVVDARDEFFQTGRTVGWAAQGGSGRYKVASAPGLDVPGAVTANMEPLPVAAVLAALADEIDPAPVARPVRMVRRSEPDLTADPTGGMYRHYAVPAEDQRLPR